MQKATKNKSTIYKPQITIDPNMRDYSDDPFIVKKVERARAFIAKHGLPDEKLLHKGSRGS